MKFKLVLVVLISSLISPFHAYALELNVQTYESCSLRAWDLLKDLDGFQADMPQNVDGNAKKIYDVAKEKGPAVARLSVLGNYAFCMKDVKQDAVQNVFSGRPRYLSCGETAAINYRILGDLNQGKTIEDLYAVLPQEYHDQIRLFAGLMKDKSFDAAMNSAAETTKSCIESERGSEQ